MEHSLESPLISRKRKSQKAHCKPFFGQSARAGIRTRVGGMKTHYDGPSYTTRATGVPPTTPS